MQLDALLAVADHQSLKTKFSALHLRQVNRQMKLPTTFFLGVCWLKTRPFEPQCERCGLAVVRHLALLAKPLSLALPQRGLLPLMIFANIFQT
jgi:hypothetical protein